MTGSKHALIVFAHPDRRSLNGSFLGVSVKELEAQGYEVKISDLCAMKWKPQIDTDDFPKHDKDARLQVAAASGEAFHSHTLTAEVVAEQKKLEWADLVIFQFPLWWFSMPAIMKGWVERVYSFGLAYGVGEHNDKKWGDRYGDGGFAGKRAMLVITVGGRQTHYGPRGVNGPIEGLLFPINHGILFYPGFTVLPPFLVFGANTMKQEVYEEWAAKWKKRLQSIDSIKPISYRKQNGGDFVMPQVELRPESAGRAKKGSNCISTLLDYRHILYVNV